MEKLLNWDHEVIPTTLEDLLLNLCEVSTKFTGRATRVRVENKKNLILEQLVPEKVETKFYECQGVLLVDEVKTKEYWKTALVINIHQGRETLGRLHNLVGGVNRFTLSTFVDKSINNDYYENKQ